MTQDPTTPAQPDAAMGDEDLVQNIAEFACEWEGRASITDDHRDFATQLVDWITRSGFAPAPADHDRPNRAEVLAAFEKVDRAAFTWGQKGTGSNPHYDLWSEARDQFLALIERLTPEAGSAAGGE